MKKFLSILLSLALTLSICAVPALAAEDADTDDSAPEVKYIKVRDTDFFTPQPHDKANYDELKYRYIDPEPLLTEIKVLYVLAQDEEHPEVFEERFDHLKNCVYKVDAMLSILSNMTSADAKDEWAAAEYGKVLSDLITLFDAFNGLVRDVLLLDNACSEILSSQLSEEDIEDYLDYEDMTEEELALNERETALEAAYRATVVETYTTTIDGEEYDADDLYQAYYVDGTIDLESYLEGNHEVYAPLGNIYLEMIDVRNQIARLNGYDNYAEYAYPEVYNRDYTLEDIAEFRAAVKEYLAPVYHSYSNFVDYPDQSEMPEDVAYDGVGMFDTLFPYFAELSDELLESAQFTYEHKAYDVDPAPNKTGTAYSMMIPLYNMPFYFSNASGSYRDLLTSIHELGHNNNAYWSPNDWNDPSTDIDTAEVHSQALELLMIRFYPELFGSQADIVADNTATDILYSVIQGCMFDELQVYAYSTPDVTIEMINQKYRQLAEEYGNVGASDPRPEMYGWFSIPHNFELPMYYISYATSAAGAFAFWEEAQEDYFGAVDHYLRFTAQSKALGFQDSFLECDMESPLSASYVQKLSETVHENLMLVDPYTDVYYDDWYALSVYYAALLSLMNGVDDTTFAPNAGATREQFMTILARFDDEREDADAPYTLEEGVAWAVKNGIADVGDLTAPLTREELATMLYNYANMLGLDLETEGDLSGFADADTVSEQARDALTWAVEYGLIDGVSEDLLAPQDATTRAEIATVIVNFFFLLLM